ncbi:MAG: dTMP kinase [Phycisphaerales bacterium]|nr:dTMP kinase [Phycisphaerales bacterium]
MDAVLLGRWRLAWGSPGRHSQGMGSWQELLAGRFLVFDGPDGSGKSTQIDRFSAFCGEHDVSLELVREPGGTAIGEAIRAILLDPAHQEMTVRAEMLLYMASRAQLVRERIRPALESGAMVLADRFISSTLAYQGTAGGLDIEEIMEVGRVATDGVEPDLVVIFDVDEKTSRSRLGESRDRMEMKDEAFHRRVREGYLAQARRDPARHRVIDASQSPEEVFSALIAGVEASLSGAGAV